MRYLTILELRSLITEIIASPNWVKPNIDDEMGELERIVTEEGIEIESLISAFASAKPVVLSDDIWVRLQNSDSYKIKSLDQANKLSKRYNRDIHSVVDGFKLGRPMKMPVVLELGDGTVTLVGGNTRLMASRAMGIVPTVLWLSLSTISEAAFPQSSDTSRKKIKDLIGWSVVPTKNLDKMLNGIEPISHGLSNYNEQKSDKTYFFRKDLDNAAGYLMGLIEDNGDPVAIIGNFKNRNIKWTFSSDDSLDYKWCILEFDLRGLKRFSDPEQRAGAGFTTDYIPADRIRIVPVKEWKVPVRKFIKQFR